MPSFPIAFGILLFLTTCLLMEGWAWFSHKYLLHGPLWFLHKTHHEPQETWWEWNDLVAVLYGVISTTLVVIGAQQAWNWQFYVGAGIAAYGMLYFVFHDIIIHRRVKWKQKFTSPYVNRLIRAHKLHHKHLDRWPGEAFGFLYAPRRYEVKRKS